MSSNTTRATYSVDVFSSQPTTNRFRKYTSFRAQGGTGVQAMGLVSFPAPYPRYTVNVTRATLRLVQASSETGSASFTVTPLAAPVNYSTVTWNTKPGVKGLASTVQQQRKAGAVWEFDVTRQVQAFVAGTPNYGFRVEGDTAGTVAFHGFNAASNVAPSLTVEWSLAPHAPTSLSPSGGHVVGDPQPVLAFNFSDTWSLDGPAQMSAYQVSLQTDLSKAVFTPNWDSGEQASEVPRADLGALGAPAVAEGASAYWRVRVKDNDGNWSDWSSTARFTYAQRPVVGIVSPPDGSTVDDVTPRFDWSYWSRGGYTQAKWAVGLYELVPGFGPKLVGKSGTTAGTATSWTWDKPLKAGHDYRWIVDVYDTQQREATAGVPVRSSATADFTCQPDGSIEAPTGGGFTTAPPMPLVTLYWSRAVQPDEWIVTGPDGLLWRGAADRLWNATRKRYELPTWLVRAREKHGYAVQAVVNGKVGATLSIWAASQSKGIWLFNDDWSHYLCISGQDSQLELSETVAYHEVIGARSVVPVMQGRRGYSGTVQGEVFSFGGMTRAHQDWREELEWFKVNEGDFMWLSIGTQLIPVTMSDLKWFDQASRELEWVVSFRVDQRGAFFAAVGDGKSAVSHSVTQVSTGMWEVSGASSLSAGAFDLS